MHPAVPTTRTVGDVADLTGVTVRTLHHYDAIGLLVPSGRTGSGYRCYGEADLQRLHEILLWRELGFPLEQVRRLLDDPEHDRLAALREQRARLGERRARLTTMLAAVDAAITATERGTTMDDDDIRQIFAADGAVFAHDEYAAEAEERWGDTEAWSQSQERTRGWGREDWQRVSDDGDALKARFVALLNGGTPPSAPDAVAAAEEHRAQLGRFYDCPPAMHRSLADLYLSDARFTDYYDRVAPGLARYVHDAIYAATSE
jgi:DNA-binding transcriptional MerR regulator